jgi:hypothetical protein
MAIIIERHFFQLAACDELIDVLSAALDFSRSLFRTNDVRVRVIHRCLIREDDSST